METATNLNKQEKMRRGNPEGPPSRSYEHIQSGTETDEHHTEAEYLERWPALSFFECHGPCQGIHINMNASCGGTTFDEKRGFSFSAWLMLDSLSLSDSPTEVYKVYGQTISCSLSLYHEDTPGTYTLALYSSHPDFRHPVVASAPIRLHEWFHVSVVHVIPVMKKAKAHVYVNGVEITNQELPLKVAFSDVVLASGLEGTLSQPTFYNGCLHQTQINLLHRRGVNFATLAHSFRSTLPWRWPMEVRRIGLVSGATSLDGKGGHLVSEDMSMAIPPVALHLAPTESSRETHSTETGISCWSSLGKAYLSYVEMTALSTVSPVSTFRRISFGSKTTKSSVPVVKRLPLQSQISTMQASHCKFSELIRIFAAGTFESSSPSYMKNQPLFRALPYITDEINRSFWPNKVSFVFWKLIRIRNAELVTEPEALTEEMHQVLGLIAWLLQHSPEFMERFYSLQGISVVASCLRNVDYRVITKETLNLCVYLLQVLWNVAPLAVSTIKEIILDTRIWSRSTSAVWIEWLYQSVHWLETEPRLITLGDLSPRVLLLTFRRRMGTVSQEKKILTDILATEEMAEDEATDTYVHNIAKNIVSVVRRFLKLLLECTVPHELGFLVSISSGHDTKSFSAEEFQKVAHPLFKPRNVSRMKGVLEELFALLRFIVSSGGPLSRLGTSLALTDVFHHCAYGPIFAAAAFTIEGFRSGLIYSSMMNLQLLYSEQEKADGLQSLFNSFDEHHRLLCHDLTVALIQFQRSCLLAKCRAVFSGPPKIELSQVSFDWPDIRRHIGVEEKDFPTLRKVSKNAWKSSDRALRLFTVWQTLNSLFHHARVLGLENEVILSLADGCNTVVRKSGHKSQLDWNQHGCSAVFFPVVLPDTLEPSSPLTIMVEEGQKSVYEHHPLSVDSMEGVLETNGNPQFLKGQNVELVNQCDGSNANFHCPYVDGIDSGSGLLFEYGSEIGALRATSLLQSVCQEEGDFSEQIRAYSTCINEYKEHLPKGGNTSLWCRLYASLIMSSLRPIGIENKTLSISEISVSSCEYTRYLKNVIGSYVLRSFSSKYSTCHPVATWQSMVVPDNVGIDTSTAVSPSEWNMLKQAFAHQNVSRSSFSRASPEDTPVFDISTQLGDARLGGQSGNIDSHLLYSGFYLVSTIFSNCVKLLPSQPQHINSFVEQCVLEPLLIAHSFLTDTDSDSSRLNFQATSDINLKDWTNVLEPLMSPVPTSACDSVKVTLESINSVATHLLAALCTYQMCYKEEGYLFIVEACVHLVSIGSDDWSKRVINILSGIMDMSFKVTSEHLSNRFRTNWSQALPFVCHLIPPHALARISSKLLSFIKLLRRTSTNEPSVFSPVELFVSYLPVLHVLVKYWESAEEDENLTSSDLFELLNFVQDVVYHDCAVSSRHSEDSESMDNDALEVQALLFDHLNQALKCIRSPHVSDVSTLIQPPGPVGARSAEVGIDKDTASIHDCLFGILNLLKVILRSEKQQVSETYSNDPGPQDLAVAMIGSIINGYNFGPMDSMVDAYRDEHYLHSSSSGSPSSSFSYHEDKKKRCLCLLEAIEQVIESITARSTGLSMVCAYYSSQSVSRYHRGNGGVSQAFTSFVQRLLNVSTTSASSGDDVNIRTYSQSSAQGELLNLLSQTRIRPSTLNAETLCLVSTSKLVKILLARSLYRLTNTEDKLSILPCLSSTTFLRFCMTVRDRLEANSGIRNAHAIDKLVYEHGEAVLKSLQTFRELNGAFRVFKTNVEHEFCLGDSDSPSAASCGVKRNRSNMSEALLEDHPHIEELKGPKMDDSGVMFKVDSHDIPVGGVGLAYVGTSVNARRIASCVVGGSGMWGHRMRLLKSGREKVQARNYKQHGAFRASLRDETNELEDILRNVKVSETAEESFPEQMHVDDAEDDLVRDNKGRSDDDAFDQVPASEDVASEPVQSSVSTRSQSVESSAPTKQLSSEEPRNHAETVGFANKNNPYSIVNQTPLDSYECLLVKTSGATKGELCFFRQETIVWRPLDRDDEHSEPEQSVIALTRARMWGVREIVGIWLRHYKLEPRAIEMDLSTHSRTRRRKYFFAFNRRGIRDQVVKKCLSILPVSQSAAASCTAALASPVPYQPVNAAPRDVLLESGIHERWKRRQISNFDYLMALNSIAGRTFNDITQYPVFPWTLCDFGSATLDFANPNTYRDLRRPIGALSQERLKETWSRFKALGGSPDMPFGKDVHAIQKEEGHGYMPPFMYGSHYSTPIGAVVHYLLRLSPFTESHVLYQDNHFDVADRLFYSIESTWKLTTSSISEVKELIPEFYNCPFFLVNWSKYDFGESQMGTQVDHVELPPWAWTYDPTREGFAQKSHSPPTKEQATLEDHAAAAKNFVNVMRLSLENEYVSSRLHHWIDLIFGCKQRGPLAVKHHNVYFYLTYNGAVDFEDIEDDSMKHALEKQIEQYGQCPIQLLSWKHPPRDTNDVDLKRPQELIKDLRFCRDVAECCDPGIIKDQAVDNGHISHIADCSHLFVAPTYKHKLLHSSVLGGMSFWRPLPTLPMDELMRYRICSSPKPKPEGKGSDKVYGFSVGDVVNVGSAKPASSAMIFSDGVSSLQDIVLQYRHHKKAVQNPTPLAFPLAFRLQARLASTGYNGESLAVWQPLAPKDYCALGCVVTCISMEKATKATENAAQMYTMSVTERAAYEITGGLTPPTLDSIVCVHESLVKPAGLSMRVHSPLNHCYMPKPSKTNNGAAPTTQRMHVNSLWSIDSPFASFVIPNLDDYLKNLSEGTDHLEGNGACSETADYREWYSYSLAKTMAYTLKIELFNRPFENCPENVGGGNFGAFRSPWLHDTIRIKGMGNIISVQAVPNGQGRCVCVDSHLNVAVVSLTVLYGTSEDEKNFVPVSRLPDVPWKRWLSNCESSEELYVDHYSEMNKLMKRYEVSDPLAFYQELSWTMLCRTLKRSAKSEIDSEQMKRLGLVCNSAHADELLKWSTCPTEIAFPYIGNLYWSSDGTVRSVFDSSVPTDLALKVDSVLFQDSSDQSSNSASLSVSLSPRANIMAVNADSLMGIRILAIDTFDGTPTAGMDLSPVNSKVTALSVVDDGSFVAAGFSDGGACVWPVLSLHDGFGSISSKENRNSSEDSGRVRSRRSVSSGILSTVSLSQPMAPTRPHMEFASPTAGEVTCIAVSSKYDAIIVGYVGESWLYELGRARPLKCWKWNYGHDHNPDQDSSSKHLSNVKCVAAEFVTNNGVVLAWDGFCAADELPESSTKGHAVFYITREDVDQRVTASPLKWKHPYAHGIAVNESNRQHFAYITCMNVLDSNPAETGTCDYSPFSGPSRGSYGDGPSETLGVGDSQGNVILLDSMTLQPLVHFFCNSPTKSISKADARGYFFVGCAQGCVSAFGLSGIENVATKKNASIIAFEKVSNQVQRHAAALGNSALATKDNAERAASSTKQFASEFRSTMRGVFNNVFGSKKDSSSK